VRVSRRAAVVALCCFLSFCWLARSDEKFPRSGCDVLSFVVVKVAGKDMRFLLETAATSILDAMSFSSGA